MSTMAKHCELCCDFVKKDGLACGIWMPTPFTRKKQARKYLADTEGWTHKGNKDFCRVCTSTMKRLAKE